MAATLPTLYTEYYLWHFHWLKLLGWFATRNPLSFSSFLLFCWMQKPHSHTLISSLKFQAFKQTSRQLLSKRCLCLIAGVDWSLSLLLMMRPWLHLLKTSGTKQESISAEVATDRSNLSNIQKERQKLHETVHAKTINKIIVKEQFFLKTHSRKSNPKVQTLCYKCT